MISRHEHQLIRVKRSQNDLAVLKQGIPDGFYKTSGSDDKTIAAELHKRNKQERSRFKISTRSATRQEPPPA